MSTKNCGLRLVPGMLLAALLLSACAGSLPSELPSDLEVELSRTGSGMLARVEFTGRVEAMAPEAWTVSGQVVGIAPQTEIQGAILVGDTVKVEAEIGPDGVLVARAIWALFSLGRVTRVTFEGVLTSQIGDVWVVGGIPVHLDPRTDVEGAIVPGRTVEVSGTTEPGGEIRAQVILLRGFELTGVVEEIDERDWIIGGQSVFVPSDARVDPGITPGARVTTQLRVDDDGEYFARSITLLDPVRSPATPSPAPVRTDEPEDGGETDFEGSVESISSSGWVVSGVLVLIDDQTEIDGDLGLGDTVRVEGVLQPGGAILAERIRALEDETLETEETAAAPHPRHLRRTRKRTSRAIGWSSRATSTQSARASGSTTARP